MNILNIEVFLNQCIIQYQFFDPVFVKVLT